MRAERRAGELLAEMKQRGQRANRDHNLKPGGKSSKSQPATSSAPKLSDLGVTKTQSSRWQKLAALDDDQFETLVDRLVDMAVRVLARNVRARSATKRKSKASNNGKVQPRRRTAARDEGPQRAGL